MYYTSSSSKDITHFFSYKINNILLFSEIFYNFLKCDTGDFKPGARFAKGFKLRHVSLKSWVNDESQFNSMCQIGSGCQSKHCRQ